MYQNSEYIGAGIYLVQFFSLLADLSVISLGYFNYLKINLLKQTLAYIWLQPGIICLIIPVSDKPWIASLSVQKHILAPLYARHDEDQGVDELYWKIPVPQKTQHVVKKSSTGSKVVQTQACNPSARPSGGKLHQLPTYGKVPNNLIYNGTDASVGINESLPNQKSPPRKLPQYGKHCRWQFICQFISLF